MSIIATKPENDGNYEQIPSGTFQAVCYAVWDLGNQLSTWEGQEKTSHKIIIAWEINETMQNGENKGKRFVISKRYTLSLGDKANLLKDLQSWRGRKFTDEELKGFDVESVIGANCMLGISHIEKDGKTYANVSSVSQIMKGLPKIERENNNTPPEWVTKIIEKQVPAMTGKPDHIIDWDAISPKGSEEVPF